jgi:hypothetical protein
VRGSSSSRESTERDERLGDEATGGAGRLVMMVGLLTPLREAGEWLGRTGTGWWHLGLQLAVTAHLIIATGLAASLHRVRGGEAAEPGRMRRLLDQPGAFLFLGYWIGISALASAAEWFVFLVAARTGAGGQDLWNPKGGDGPTSFLCIVCLIASLYALWLLPAARRTVRRGS